jgi:adenylate kinase
MLMTEQGVAVAKVVELQVPMRSSEDRIYGRWIHKLSGRSFHVKSTPPKSSMNLDADAGDTA